VSPLFRLGLCAFLLLLLAAAFLCAGSFFNAPALFRLGGLATGPLFRFGLLAFLGQPLLLASLLVLGAFRLFAFPFFSAFGALAAPLLFAPAAILGLPLLLASRSSRRRACFASRLLSRVESASSSAPCSRAVSWTSSAGGTPTSTSTSSDSSGGRVANWRLLSVLSAPRKPEVEPRIPPLGLAAHVTAAQ
jgi:hypothetical protein